jgi:hypothetical protein
MKQGLTGPDKEQSDHRGRHNENPEGAIRPRQGPLDKDSGRRPEEQPESPGQPAGGE